MRATAGRRALLGWAVAVLATGGWSALEQQVDHHGGEAAVVAATTTATGDGHAAAPATATTATTSSTTTTTTSAPPVAAAPASAGPTAAAPVAVSPPPGGGLAGAATTPTTAPTAPTPADPGPAAPPPPAPPSASPAAPAPPPAPSGAEDPSNHAFYRLGADGQPIRWNPCEAIHWVFNPAGGPSWALQDAQAAFDRLARASGLTFVFDGIVDEAATASRTGRDPARYPGRWAPVLVAFGQIGPLGVAQMRWSMPPTGPSVSYTGWATLQAGAAWVPGFATSMGLGRALLHELGHVVGLDHAPSPGPIMHGAAEGIDDYTPADRAGLRRVGAAAGCLPSVPPPA